MRWRRAGQWRESGTTIERIATFSDGVFAIAITLLVLQIRLPDIPRDQVGAQLPGALRDLIPKFTSYAFTFLIIGLYWMGHHRIFNLIRRYDRTLLWLNLAFLLFVSFLPFPSQLVGAYGSHRIAQIFYDASLALTGLSMVMIWVYASAGHRLIDPTLERRMIAYITLRGLTMPVTALLVIGASFIDVGRANLTWVLAAVFSFILQRRYRFEQSEEDALDLGEEERAYHPSP